MSFKFNEIVEGVELNIANAYNLKPMSNLNVKEFAGVTHVLTQLQKGEYSNCVYLVNVISQDEDTRDALGELKIIDLFTVVNAWIRRGGKTVEEGQSPNE